MNKISTLEFVNVICMKWGTSYIAKDVNILYSMVKRNLTLPHRFVCFTDDKTGIRSEVECFDLPFLPIPSYRPDKCWQKIATFNSSLADLKGKTLFLDLDLVIIDNIDCFFSYSDQFTIIKDWRHNTGNSSVYSLLLENMQT